MAQSQATTLASEVTTEPNSPGFLLGFGDDGSRDQTFALMHPLDTTAREAFDRSVKEIALRQLTYQEKFIKRSCSERVDSSFSEDSEGARLTELFWTGAFAFRLTDLPPGRGWLAGTGLLKAEGEPKDDINVEIMLAPPREKYRKKWHIAGRHMCFVIDEKLYRLKVTARHTVTLGSDRSITKGQSIILNDKDLITVGGASYVFEYTPYFKSSGYEDDLRDYLSQLQGEEVSIDSNLTPRSIDSPFIIGHYSISSTALSEGTFGRLRAAWTKEGKTFAVKQLKKGYKQWVSAHVELLKRIVEHENVLNLVEDLYFVDQFFLVYQPLAMANLEMVIRKGRIDLQTKLCLFRDFLRGLAHLHACGLMHRDIKERNLAVTSFSQPQGLIVDLDSITAEMDSRDHMQGTIPSLAPEILALKVRDERGLNDVLPSYTSKVDVWALGLSSWALYTSQIFRWKDFAPHPADLATQPYDRVNSGLYSGFRNALQRAPQEDLLPMWVLLMTEWTPQARLPAPTMLEEVQKHDNWKCSAIEFVG